MKLLNDIEVATHTYILSIYIQYTLLVYYIFNDYASVLEYSSRLAIGLCTLIIEFCEVVVSIEKEKMYCPHIQLMLRSMLHL